jgi:hypothetical protein
MRARWLSRTLAIVWFTAAPVAATPAFAGPQGGTDCERKAAARPTLDCVSCEASVVCLERITGSGGSAEIIPISHGVMVLYNTANLGRVGEVQTAAFERWDVMDRVLAGQAEGHLCASCCAARSLIVRAERQIYRTSTGVVTMITSDDFTIVRELHRMVPKKKAFAKSE